MEKFNFLITEEEKGQRLDAFVALMVEDINRTAAQRLIDSGEILVNGLKSSNNYKLKIKDEVTVSIADPTPLDVVAQDIPIEIIYEDNDLLVVNKPKGMVVHPAAGNPDGTLVNALLFHCKDSLSGINGVMRPGIVHRIDKDTSGLLVVAKSDVAHHGLAEQIKFHSFKREYEAVVYGDLKKDKGKINYPIGRHRSNRKKMCVTDINAKEAVTYYEVIKRYNGFTHVRLTLETGRTHQIRVHMAYLGHPVVGDVAYGFRKVIKELNGQCLHARVIGFVHPVTCEYMEFRSDMPEYFTKFLSEIETIN